ncbi:MAG: radical SAM protein [Planctomycetota bacterium]|nr:radical SAM protein [Planctomycetota bacterium]
MKDGFGRTINYLRVSVTDRCNLRCQYCLPQEGISWLEPGQLLSYEEIAGVVRVGSEMGISKVRITGGEPLVRRNIVSLVVMLAATPGINDLSLSTNGVLLAQHARELTAAGLQRVNVSLDTLDPAVYRRITGGELEQALAGIAAARSAGLNPVNLNCVVTESSDEPDARSVAQFAREQGLVVRFIRRMSLRAGTFSIVENGSGGDCPRCNRLRLSCAGVVRPCLFSDLGFSVREYGARGALERAVQAKPRRGAPCNLSTIGAIGG